MFFLLYRHINHGVIDDFPKISDNFPKISEHSPKFVRRLHERCRTFPENFRRLPKTFEEDPKIFRSYTNECKYNLRDKLDISESVDILTSEDMIRNSSPGCGFVWILRVVYFPVKRSCLYNESDSERMFSSVIAMGSAKGRNRKISFFKVYCSNAWLKKTFSPPAQTKSVIYNRYIAEVKLNLTCVLFGCFMVNFTVAIIHCSWLVWHSALSQKGCHDFVSEQHLANSQARCSTSFLAGRSLNEESLDRDETEALRQTSHDQFIIKRFIVKRFIPKENLFILCSELKTAIRRN